MSHRQLIYVPEIHPESFVFFYYRGTSGNSWSIRDYTRQPEVLKYQKDFSRTADEVLKLAAKPGRYALPAPAHRTDDWTFWNRLILETNAKYLGCSGPALKITSAGPPPPRAPEPEVEIATGGRGLPIYGRSRQAIHTLADWFLYAPPAGGERHWKPGRSAMELARRWLAGMPEEIERLLATSPAFREFRPEEARAEVKSPLDGFAGNTRNADLVVHGRCGDDRVLLDLEGKADEAFGPTIADRLARAAEELRENPRSQAAERVRLLCGAVFGVEPEQVRSLRYQLLHGIAGALGQARLQRAPRVAFIVHEFQTRSTNPEYLARNAGDLEAVVRRLGGAAEAARLRAGELAGPVRVPGSEWIPADVDLYIGKAVARLL